MKTKQIVFTKAYTAELLDVEWEAPKAGAEPFLDGGNTVQLYPIIPQ